MSNTSSNAGPREVAVATLNDCTGDGLHDRWEEEEDAASGYSEGCWDAYIDNWEALYAEVQNDLPRVRVIINSSVF